MICGSLIVGAAKDSLSTESLYFWSGQRANLLANLDSAC